MHLAQVVEAIEGVVKPEHRQVLGGLEDAENGYTSGGRIMERGRRAAPSEALEPLRIFDPRRNFQLPGATERLESRKTLGARSKKRSRLLPKSA